MRKHIVFVAGLLALLVIVGAASSREVFADEGLTKIAEDVYSYVDVKGGGPQNSFGANAGAIIGRDGIVVIDTLISSSLCLHQPLFNPIKGFANLFFGTAERQPNVPFAGGTEGAAGDGDHACLLEQAQGEGHRIHLGRVVARHQVIRPLRFDVAKPGCESIQPAAGQVTARLEGGRISATQS